MRVRGVVACLLILIGMTSASNAQPFNVVEVDAIDGTTGFTLHGNSISTTTMVHLASYHCLSGLPCRSDGGEGLLVLKTGQSCKYPGQGGSGTLEDGGSFFADNGHHCWYRANLTGDLRQWGITTGSVYDASNSATPTAADTVLFNAITAFSAVGIQTIHTGQVSIFLEAFRIFNSGWSFTCDVPPVREATNQNFAHIPGSVVLGHGAYLDALTNADVEIHDCAVIIPQWYINPSSTVVNWTGGVSGFSVPAALYSDLEAVRTNMITAGDVAVEAGTSAKIHDLTILGFDNCLYVNRSPDFIGKNIATDCSVGAYFYNENGSVTLKDFNATPRLTKQTGTGISNEEYWTVTAGTNDTTTGECKLTLYSVKGGTNGAGGFKPLYPVSDLTVSGLNSALGLRADPNSYPAWVTGLGSFAMSCLSTGTGRFGNDAAWAVYSITKFSNSNDYTTDHATVELVGSKFTTSTGASTPISVDTTADWAAGTGVLHITGSISNLAPGMTVTSSDPSLPSATVTGIVQRCTGPDPNDGYNGCIIVSPAPAAGATAVTLHFYSGSDTIPGGPCTGTGHQPCFFYNAAERYVAGPSAAGNSTARLPASRGGNLGSGLLLDNVAGIRAINVDNYGHYYHTAAIDSPDCDFLQIKGDDNGELNPGNTVGVYVAGSTRGCNFDSQGPGKPAAAIVQDTYGTSDYTGTTSGQPIQVTINTPTALNKTYTGSVTITGGSLNNWPLRGTLHVCTHTSTSGGVTSCLLQNNPPFDDEFMNYHWIDSTHFYIEVRARFGTAPTDFSAASTVTVYSTSINSGSDKHADKSATSIFANLTNSTTIPQGIQFEVLHGAATIQNIHTPVGGIAFISTNTAGVTISAADEPNTLITFEDDVARSLTTVTPDSSFGSNILQGILNLPLSYFQWGGSAQGTTGLNALGTNGVGSVTVQDTTNWPQTGILAADSEYLSFHVLDGNHLVIDRRGLCGSAPATHADGMVSFMNVLFGCPASGKGAPQFSIDNSGNVTFVQSALAHGQVYMSFDSVSINKNVLLCPFNGRGLIINGVLRVVPHNCALGPSVNIPTSGLYYVYAVYHQIAVTDVLSHSSYARLYVTSTPDFNDGTPITCYGITGPALVNVTEDNATTAGTVSGQPYIDITDVAVPTTPNPSGTGACSYVSLTFSTTAHVTASNGVEVKNGDSSQTLVGMVYSSNAIGSPGVHDTNSQRDVASWFNRRIKTCRVTWSATGTVANTAYAEVAVPGSPPVPLHCEFVSWDRSDTLWSLFGMVNNASITTTASIAGDFDGGTVEIENVQWKQNNASQQYPLGLSGSAALSEITHYFTTFGKTGATATTVSVYGGSGEEVRLEQ